MANIKDISSDKQLNSVYEAIGEKCAVLDLQIADLKSKIAELKRAKDKLEEEGGDLIQKVYDEFGKGKKSVDGITTENYYFSFKTAIAVDDDKLEDASKIPEPFKSISYAPDKNRILKEYREKSKLPVALTKVGIGIKETLTLKCLPRKKEKDKTGSMSDMVMNVNERTCELCLVNKKCPKDLMGEKRDPITCEYFKKDM